MLTKRNALVALLVLVFFIGVLIAEADASFVGSVEVGGGSVVASGTVAGCAVDDCKEVVMNVTGTDLIGYCQNAGGNIAPGIKPVTVDTDTTVRFPLTDPDDTYEFFMSTEILPTQESIGCPNADWHVVDLTGPITVTLSVYGYDDSQPWDSQTFACQAVFGIATDCVRIE